MTSKKDVKYVNLHPETGYTHCTYVKAGNFIFTSYHAATSDDGGNPLTDIESQTENIFKNLETTLKDANASLDDIIKTTVLIKNKEDFRKMVSIYRNQFSDNFPARTTIISDFLSDNILIQIDVIAYVVD
ncbi:MAG: RidA family protein [Candidatus Hodarchaeales archaeon]|jgi:2-iminobutanoate/2-iminopropanoate deaminase